MDFLKSKKITGTITGLTVIMLVIFFSMKIFSQSTSSGEVTIKMPVQEIFVNKLNMEGLPDVFSKSYEYEYKGMYQKAIDAYKCFEKVVNLYPFDLYGNLMFAWANLKLGKTAEAKSLFERTLCINPSETSAKEGLALIK